MEDTFKAAIPTMLHFNIDTRYLQEFGRTTYLLHFKVSSCHKVHYIVEGFGDYGIVECKSRPKSSRNYFREVIG